MMAASINKPEGEVWEHVAQNLSMYTIDSRVCHSTIYGIVVACADEKCNTEKLELY